MNLKYVALVGLLAILVGACPQAMSSGTDVFPKDRSATEDWFFLGHEGWVVQSGENCGVYSSRDVFSWKKIASRCDFFKLYFLDVNDGYALSFDAATKFTWLFKTTDGGYTWNAISRVTKSPNLITDFIFTNPTEGWFAGTKPGNRALVLSTTDAGRTVAVDDRFENESGLSNVGSFKNTLVLFGHDEIIRIQNDSIRVYATGSLLAEGGVIDLRGNALSVGYGGVGILAADSDKVKIVEGTERLSLDSVAVSPADGALFAIGASTTVMTSSGNGSHWEVVGHLPMESRGLNEFTRVKFLDSRTGCALRITGALYCTENAGRNWRRVSFTDGPDGHSVR
jgi:photosystem II stability/assembly factor-like uncharacterized protein